jgi:NAD(P)-dependent dehydrogenase (short-subunit alcohol dehydrogenase family)
MNQSALAGKTVLVTGAGSGIGRGVALRFASRAAKVIAFDVVPDGIDTLAAEAGDHGTYISTAVGDVRDRSTIDAAVSGRDVDVVCAIAGVSKVGAVLDMSDHDRDVIWDVNVAGVWNTIKACLPGLLRQGPGGRIIVCGSIESILGGEGLTAYVASKHAVLGMVKSIALELAASGITANVVSPAGVDSAMLRTVVPPEAIAHIAATTPIPRLCTGDEIAAFFEFLAGPETAYMTGENLLVDGGLKLVNAHSQGQSWTRPNGAPVGAGAGGGST